jgi:hypothetical protein
VLCCQDDSYINLIHACISRTSQLKEDSSHTIEVIGSKYEINVRHVVVFSTTFV